MKIEVGENLISSYLKHVEGCRIVQTNWKTSSKWTVTEYDDSNARLLFEKIKISDSFKDIFKNNSFDQLIKQAEIDVLGLNTIEKSVYGIDVAFHSFGLNYADTEETAFRVMKKIFRTVFVMQSYFNDFDKFNSYFVTPKVNPATSKFIYPLILEARKIIQDDSVIIDFVSNEDFYSNYVDPLSGDILDENDTAELFLRSVKLLQLDPRVRAQNTSITKFPKSQIGDDLKVITDKRTVDGMKIGQFVTYNLRKMYEKDLISNEEIQNLLNKDYSKNVFNLNYEMLRNRNRNIIENGVKRYYAKEFFCGDYFLTSQWFEYNWEPFLRWMRKIQNKSESL